MRKVNLVRLVLVLSLVGLLAWSVSGVNQVAAIKGTDAGIGRYIIEDIRMCDDMQTAWMVGIANSDDARLYKYDLSQDKVVGICDVGTLYGPRGTSGLAINFACTKAYVPNYPSNTVSVIDLLNTDLAAPGEDVPDCVSLAEIPVDPKPTDVALTYPKGDKALVANSFSDEVTIIDTASDSVIDTIEVGMGPNQIDALGHELALVANRYSDEVSMLDLSTDTLYTNITGLNRVPQAVAVTPDGKKAYVANFVADTVDVLDVFGHKVIRSIPVGDSPRYVIVSEDGKFAYVSNTIDKTVSVISTATDSVVDTIQVVPEDEPAPIGVIALTKDNRYLYVWWTGGRSGTPADFVIFKFDVGQLYQP